MSALTIRFDKSLALASSLFGFLAATTLAGTITPSPKSFAILPQTFLRGYDPVTVLFPEPAGPAKPGPEDHPERFLKVEPPQPGEFRWLDAATLVFKPAAAWPPLERIRFTVAGQTRMLATLMVPPQSLVPADGETDLGQVDEVTLSFPSAIATENLVRMVAFELRPLPGIENAGARWLQSDDYSLKAVERNALNEPARYVFRFKRPVEPGTRVLTHIRLSLDDTARDSIATYSFSTREPFRVVAAGCHSGRMRRHSESDDEENSDAGEGRAAAAHNAALLRSPGMLSFTRAGSHYSKEQAVNGGTGAARVSVLFSADLAPMALADVKALIQFEPAIPEMTVSQSGPSLQISGKFDRNTVYHATIGHGEIKDKSGRSLTSGGPSDFYFYFLARPPHLRWSQAQGIIERFGPQMLPMSARGEGRVDLRIYKVKPLDLNFWPFPKTPVVVDEAARPPAPGEEPPSAETLPEALSASDLALRLKLMVSPPVSTLAAVPVRHEGGDTNFGLPLKEHLKAISGPEQPGTYLVGIRRLNGESNRSYARIQVTDLCLSTVEEERAVVFLVTSLRTGLPVPGAEVTVEGVGTHSDSSAFRTVLSGTTDEHGRYRYVHSGRFPGQLRRIVVKKETDTLVLLPSDPPQPFTDNHWHGTKGSWLGWLQEPPAAMPAISSLLIAHLLTERPVYRPEEEVHIKGYLRVRENGRLALPPEDKYEVRISGPGDKFWALPVKITPEGSFYLKFQEKNLPAGKYGAVLRNIRTQSNYGGAHWSMEAYKIPKFEVDIQGPDRVPMDRPFTLTATSKYYAGGRVVGEHTTWRVAQAPFVYQPHQTKGFVFSSDERYSNSGRFTSNGTIEKRDVTDGSGATRITVNPAIELDARPRRYTFEVTVTGPDEQTVTNSRQVVALPAFVLGLKVDRFTSNARKITPEIIAVAPTDKLLPGQEVMVRLLERQWHSTLTQTDFSNGKAKYLTDVVDNEVYKTTVKTTEKPVGVDLPTPAAGIYVVELSARDAVGRLQVVSLDLYVGGPQSLAWKKPEANVFETVPDKSEYAPGQEATILLKSPYQEAHALVVVEGPDGNDYQELSITGGKALFRVPIKPEYCPRLPVHFLLMRGRIPGGIVAGADLGKPGTMAATTWLKVEPRENRLNVELKHPEKALPGQEISISIKLTRPGGLSAPGEVTLWLVDQAVLALGKEKELDPLPAFIKDVESHLAIRDTRNSTIGEVVTEETPGSGGSEEAGLTGRVTVRRKFKTVPYYNPQVPVDSTGTATVTFKLSDDLTNFKIRAVATSGPDRFGAGKSTIAVRLPVIVQPALPRFVRISDTFRAGGIGRVVEGDGGPGRFEVKTQGAVLSGEASGSLTWVRDVPQKLLFPLTVVAPVQQESTAERELTMTLAIERTSDSARDAFEVKIPILPDREPDRAESFLRLNPNQPIDFPRVHAPVRAGTTTQELLVTDQEAILKMVTALDYLYEFKDQCTEQHVSRAYPLVALHSLFEAFKLNPSHEKVNEILSATIDYLGKTLQPSGLYSYWPGGQGYVSLTAYVVGFLAEARRAGRTFPPKLLDKPIAALKAALRSDYTGFVEGASFTERCEALRALSLAGSFDVAYGSELARKAGYLDLYSESQVLLAYAAGQKGGTGVTGALRSDLWDNTVFKLRDGQEVYGGLQSRIKTWGGLILSSETKTLATVIRALHAMDGASPRLKLMVDELVRTGEKDGWGNSNTNAAALLALRDVLARPRTYDSAPTFAVDCGGISQPLRLDPTHPTAHFRTGSADAAKVTWTGGAPREAFYARMRVTSIPLATGETVAQASAGFVVRREVIRVPGDSSPPVKAWIEKAGENLTFTLGDVVEEHVQIINGEERNFVEVVAPLAAGMEPMNPNLATSAADAKPSAGPTLEPSYMMYLDDEVHFYYETLPAGTFDFYFRTRATTEGSFVEPAARAAMMYQPAVRGNSPGVRYIVQKRGE